MEEEEEYENEDEEEYEIEDEEEKSCHSESEERAAQTGKPIDRGGKASAGPSLPQRRRVTRQVSK